MTSIYEVAQEAGVSITTVSHVFSGRRPVSPQTQACVRDAAKKLNYQPHRIARGLATGRTMILGVQFPFEGDLMVSNPYFPELLEGFSSAAAKVGYGFLLIPKFSENTAADHEKLLERIDGAIIVDPNSDEPDVIQLVESGISVVTTGRHLGPYCAPWIDNDHPHGIAQLFQHFDQQSYHRPALISAKLKYSYIEDIESAFIDQTRARGTESWIARADNFSEQQTYPIAMEMLKRTDRPDMIVACTDLQAIHVLRAAQDLGIRVPDELGVAGEGDTILARNAIPTLTSIRVHSRRLGEAAVAYLLDILDGNENSRGQLLPAELIVRNSTSRT